MSIYLSITIELNVQANRWSLAEETDYSPTIPIVANASALLYSIIETAKANGLILYDYMAKCMKELAKSEPDINSLLPWNFAH